jgi:SAM-dependent methyltransferase
LLKTTLAPGVPQPTFLDLGTCVGQDLRKLAHDGVPISTLYGSDLFPAFEKVGHALFRDADRFGPSRFICGDVFSDEPNDPLFATRGTWSVINIIMFLHLFSMEDQEHVCGSLLGKFLRPRAGAVVMGAQTGTIKSGNMELKTPMCEPGEHKVVFRHSRETLMEMWERVAKRIGVKVKVWLEYDQDEIREREKGTKEDKDWEKKNRFFVGDDERRILFWVERQE